MQLKSFVIMFTIFLTVSCNQNLSKKVNENKSNNTKPKEIVVQNVPYTIARNYFVRNDFKRSEHLNSKITTKEEFDEIFGMASFAGERGKPTAIDFSKQYVLAIIGELTNHDTEIVPVSLQQKGGTIIFDYKINEGGKTLTTIQPALLIVVDKKYDGEITLAENRNSN
jgi:hypothetical protein